MADTSNARVIILMGSDSDLPVMSEAVKVLDDLKVKYDLHVTSAHRTPDRTVKIVRNAVEDGAQVFIAGAGGAAHLAGVVAAHTTLPVLGVPLAGANLDGLDALLATAQMPAGIPVGTLAIGKPGAANAAWMAAAIAALSDPALADRLAAARRAMAEKVEQKSEAAREKLER